MKVGWALGPLSSFISISKSLENTKAEKLAKNLGVGPFERRKKTRKYILQSISGRDFLPSNICPTGGCTDELFHAIDNEVVCFRFRSWRSFFTARPLSLTSKTVNLGMHSMHENTKSFGIDSSFAHGS